MKQQKQIKQPKLTKEQQIEMMNSAKRQRNLEDLQNNLQKLMKRLDEMAYKIEHTANKKIKEKLEKDFDKKMSLIISLQQGNFSIETH